MRKTIKLVSLIGLLLIGIAGFRGSSNAQAATSKDIAVKALTAGEDHQLLNNQDRGLRLEVNLDVHSGMGLWGNANKTGIDQLSQAVSNFSTDQPKLAQVYFYLTAYKDKPLDEKAFSEMNDYFQALAQHHIKAVLRFAYIWDDANPKAQEPTTTTVLQHLHQLEPWIKAHRDQISVLQAGLIGSWGEWDGGARRRMDEKSILRTLLAVTPKDLPIQVRYYNIKANDVARSSADWNRVGFHDDYLIGNLHEWNTAGNDPNSAAWKAMATESKTVPVDGEMIWGVANASDHGGKLISAKLSAQRLAQHHFTSLSLAHNYKEDGQPYSMMSWQHQYINRAILDRLGLPYQPSWFKKSDGENVNRTWFDYIRDYLGYRVALTKANEATVNGQTTYQLTLKNYGFAAPMLTAQAKFVLLDKDKKIVAEKSVDNFKDLQTGSEETINWSVTETNQTKAKYLAFFFAGYDGTGNRLANDMTFSEGYNIISTF